MKTRLIILSGLFLIQIPQLYSTQALQFSGIYPHLAYYNHEGECGTGAVVPWAGRLWVITYGPHFPNGSSDKLYEITPDLQQIVHPQSIGGTPANRMIHTESRQLFIGPYAIDRDGSVRVIPYKVMPGRHTANARHLNDPANKIYYATMEEGFYEVDVHSLEVNCLYRDNHIQENDPRKTLAEKPLAELPGAHGKGAYTGQGVLVYANNGEKGEQALKQFDIESGSLSEWDGMTWTLVRRNQFCEVTGPGGIYGNKNPATDPIWATGWDHKSLLLGVRYEDEWSFYRLPKSSHSYDGAHGWNTEWPRIRDIGTPDRSEYLMTMHGMFWTFPDDFTPDRSAGIRPRSAYLKVIGDFCRWNEQLVFGCDDSAQREFLNKRQAKGGISGPGQSNSNLWFTSFDRPDQLGPITANGAVWLEEPVAAHQPSEPFLFAGWPKRCVWIKSDAEGPVNFTFELDRLGDNTWETLKSLTVLPNTAGLLEFDFETKGEWIRVIPDSPCTATIHFSYAATEGRLSEPDELFDGLASVQNPLSHGGLLYGLGDDRRALAMAAMRFDHESAKALGYYELDAEMNLVRKQDPEIHSFIQEKFAIPEKVIEIQKSSVLIIDDQNRRWRLPLGDQAFTPLVNQNRVRICREVATERDLFNCHGTFYELPAENADGYAKIRPIASHDFRIHDYASYRGMLIMTGVDPQQANENSHIIRSEDGKAAVWAGVIDDLWKLGQPTGRGGPWKASRVRAQEPSDPYLIAFYDRRALTLSHDAKEPVVFTLQVDPSGHGPWMDYRRFTVAAKEKIEFSFPENVQARWIRFITNRDCRATAWLEYR